MPAAVYFKKQNNTVNIIFDSPELKVNILSTAVMREFNSILDEIEKDTSITGVLITSNKKGIFIAGADINEIKGIKDEAEGEDKAKAGQEIFNKLERLTPPTLAVINGVAVGGGLELALACKYRVAGFSENIQIGLPEIRLGVIPGFGGAQRLTRLIGIRQALAMIPAGKIISAKNALRIGLVDNLFPDNILLEEAIEFLKKPSKRKKPSIEIIPKWLICKIAKKKVIKKTKGLYPAPIKAIEVIEKGSLEYEAKVFGQLVITDIAQNLIHVFFLTEKYKHMDWGVGNIKPTPINKCGIVGAGVMGGGIAHLLSNYNIPVRIRDITLTAIAKGLETARKMYTYPLKIKKIKPFEVINKMGLISGTLLYKGFKNTDIVIEAVVEDIKIKESVFSELGRVVSPKTIIASNTSSLSVTRMAEACANPERVIGMHFFNPVDRMPLVEVIITKYTSRETIASVISLSRQLGKTPIVVKDRAGFLVNRILLPYMNGAAQLLMDGNSIDHIDNAMTSFGMPMGPLLLADTIGIGICYKIAKILENAFGPRMAVAPILKEIQEHGLHFYIGKKPNPQVYALMNPSITPRLESRGINKGHTEPPPLIRAIQRNPIVKFLSQSLKGNGTVLRRECIKNKKADTKEAIQKYLIDLMVNEADLILKEGIVEDPDTIDIGMIFGTGFPPFKGGLLKYAGRP